MSRHKWRLIWESISSRSRSLLLEIESASRENLVSKHCHVSCLYVSLQHLVKKAKDSETIFSFCLIHNAPN